MTDAREKLGQIAKQTDARVRLLKLRERQRGTLTASVRNPQSRVLSEPGILQRTVQPRLNSLLHEEELMDYSDGISYLNRNYTERITMDEDMYDYAFRGRQEASVLYRTVENDLPHNKLFESDKSYSWSKPTISNINEYSDIPTSRITMGMNRNLEPRGYSSSWEMDDTPIVITKKVKPQETVGILKRFIYIHT